MAADKFRCKKCTKNVAASGTVATQLRYRKHSTEQGEECGNSRTLIPMWIIQRGPETSEDDRPVIGRDYGPCPNCGRSPLLDDERMYMKHIVKAGVPAAEQVVCDMSGKPYVSAGEACTPAPSTPAPEGRPSTAAPKRTTAPTRDAVAPGPNESEEMISKWAKTARKIENRELPPPSPESTSTPPDSPPQPSDPGPSTPATNPTGADSADGAGAGASSPPEKPCHIAGPHPPHRWMHKRRQAQCLGKPVPTTARTESAPAPASAEDAAAASEAAPSSTSTSEPKPAEVPTGPPPDIEALAKVFPRAAAENTPTASGPTDGAAAAPADEPPPPGETTAQEGQECKPGTAAGPSPATPPLPPVPAVIQRAPTRVVAAAPTASPNPPSPIAESSATAKSPASPAPASPCAEFSTTPESTSSAAVSVEPPFVRPGSPFVQPGPVEPAPAAVPMTVMAERLVARVREIFYSYGNRKTDDNRGAQATLGPSEIGTPCDRRIAMSLLRIPPVNPGTDGWSAFKGSAIHAALADMFTWASGNTGRFAVEVPLRFPSELVPKGTADLLDRVLFMLDDHKIQGRWSQEKLRIEGIPPAYRVQLHTYGFGQRLQGERVDYVALLSWPMESSSLDDLYAVIEPYDPQVARDALARVDRIAAEVQGHQSARGTWAGLDITAHHLGIARQFPVADDCKWCPFFAPGDPDMKRGCPGR